MLPFNTVQGQRIWVDPLKVSAVATSSLLVQGADTCVIYVEGHPVEVVGDGEGLAAYIETIQSENAWAREEARR